MLGRMPVLWLVTVLALALGAGVPTQSAAQTVATALPSFAELEAVQARIGEVRVLSADVFDTTDPKDCLLYTSDAADEL